MSDIKQELDKIRGRISEPSFLKNEGLSNEVGIHVFCYDPADELIVRDFVSRLKAESGTPYHIKECDLYEIFLRLLEDKRVLICSSNHNVSHWIWYNKFPLFAKWFYH